MADYIKREDLLDLYDLGGLEVENAKVPLNVVIQNIKDIPSADAVERKRGKWIDSKCSECGGLIPLTKVMLHGKVMWETDYPMSRFCPNCGADMREEKMTNKEWMATLTAEQFYNKMMNLIYNYGFRFDNTRLAIINWLDEPHETRVKYDR